MKKIVSMMTVACGLTGMSAMAENRIDTQLPNAPELAAYGDHAIGVRSMDITNPDQVDIFILGAAKERPADLPKKDRSLTVEVWYPAAKGASGNTTLKSFIRDGKTEVALEGKAVRDAAPAKGKFPLVIVSHGWPGNRYLLSHLSENIASKGYVVAAIDHTESTYRTFQPVEQYFATFGSTLVNRPYDQLFTLDSVAKMAADSSSFLYGMVDTENTAIIGYSMGGYGAVVTSGGGVSAAAVTSPIAAAHGTLSVHVAGSETHNALPDPRIKTSIAIAPWGRNWGVWDAEGLKGIKIPMLYIAGSQDDVSGYENGVRQIWKESTGTKRALLTFNHANHNAAAPIPAPAEANKVVPAAGGYLFDHYADAVWDTARMNNITQHFATAWLDMYLKGDEGKGKYLDLVPESDKGVWSLDEAGKRKDDHSHWEGFPNRWAKGLRYEVLEAGQ